MKDTGVLEKRENESKSVKGVCKAKQESEASLRKKPQKEEAGYTPKKKRHLLPPAKVKDARVLEKRENESKRVKGVCKAKQESEASLRKEPQKEEAWYPPKKTPPATTCLLEKRENESKRVKGVCKAKQESEASLRKKPQKEEARYTPKKKHHLLPPAKVKDARVLEKKGRMKAKESKECVKRSKKAKQACARSPKKRREGNTPPKKNTTLPPAKVKDARVLETRENESKRVKGVCKAKQESEASLRKKPQKEEAGYPPPKKTVTCYHLPR